MYWYFLFFSEPNGEDLAKYHFTLSSEKGVIKFGCMTSTERDQWVQWLTRATGQTDKPKDKPGKKYDQWPAISYTELY